MNDLDMQDQSFLAAAPPELLAGLADRDWMPSGHEEAVRRVCALYQAARRDQTDTPVAYQVGGEWASYLAERDWFHQALLRGDLGTAGEGLRQFWRNNLGAIVKEYARFEQLRGGDAAAMDRFVSGVRRNFQIWQDIYGEPASVLALPAVGNPWGLEIEGVVVAPKAVRYAALSRQIQNLLIDHERPLVLEIGAGYGGTAYYMLRDRPEMRYADFDLPETLALIAYYLICGLPERSIHLYGETLATDTPFQTASTLLLPNYMLPRAPTRSADLVLNTFSLSEMPYETLSEYIGQIQRVANGYFLHHNMDRAGVINRGFERIPASRYPLDQSLMSCIARNYDLFHGHAGDYREYLYQRRQSM